MKDDTEAYLKVLEHLCYVIECVSLDYMGEAKYELSALIRKIKEEWEIPGGDTLASRLEKADEQLRRDKGAGAGLLASNSRDLWKKVL